LLPAGGGDGSEGFVMPGVSSDDFTGLTQFGNAGDVNGDGLGDLIIGVAYASLLGRYGGETFVVFGRDAANAGFPAVVPLEHLFPPVGTGQEGFVLLGTYYSLSGTAASAAGDLNDDGIGDVAIGAPISDGIAGRTYVVFGRDTAQSGDFPAAFPLGRLLPAGGGDGSTGFVLKGVDGGDISGSSLSAAGDVNGDGIGDLIIGAPQVDQGPRQRVGNTYVVFGRSASNGP
jgi:hypothetical protein